ncbi:MAG: aldolase catalytic domain-containing protein [Oligoflexia bacterium]|nr:aldolase catalytic domain-containing protein [Oligoflexia bacterium]
MIQHKRDKDAKGTWLTYRPDIKILDCTVRDGGLINNHFFEEAFVKKVYDTCVAAGIDYMEIGYKADKKIFPAKDNGAWKYSDEDMIKKITGDNKGATKISVMADAERTNYHEDILPKEKSCIDIIRVATYIHQIPTALDMVEDAHQKGYETTVNLMAVSTVHEKDLVEALDVIAKSSADAVYIVDSFGSFYTEQIRELTDIYLKAMEGTGKEVGIHTHNNQQLAYANTIESVIRGASRIDATINGMGRGAGNCPLELIVGFLKNPKFDLRPILKCVQDEFIPLLKNNKMEWGYQIPYFITGQMNLHPRFAIKMRASENPDNYLEFYDQIIQEES